MASLPSCRHLDLSVEVPPHLGYVRAGIVVSEGLTARNEEQEEDLGHTVISPFSTYNYRIDLLFEFKV